MKEILIILPTRMRAQKIEAAIQAWRDTTSGRSELLVCLDDDDPQLRDYKRHDDVTYDVGSRIRMCPTVNRALDEHPGYKYYGFIGDDHNFRTLGWEDHFISRIEQNAGWGIVYGDDLLQGQNLATAAVISANILNAVGYMALPATIHLYMDNFWMELGKATNTLLYEPRVVIEHVHFAAGKAPIDHIYSEANANDEHDKKVFEAWLLKQKEADVQKVEEAKRAPALATSL